MSMQEFELIQRFFTQAARHAVLGVGDDCALLAPTPGQQWAISTDMLVAGTHFLADTEPEALGHKALAVNLSDLAACGAQPRFALLALALPVVDEAWLASFAQGLFALAQRHEVELVGGDTTRGPLNICITVLGEVPAGEALLRSGAVPDDEIWVSGTLGDAALGLAALQGQVNLEATARAACVARLCRPTPRLALGLALRGLAHAAIDISDGLVADLGHILERSQCAAAIDFVALPRSAALASCTDEDRRAQCVLAGGDDYELCFTAAPAQAPAIEDLAVRLGVPLTRVGRIVAGPAGALSVGDAAGRPMAISSRGFDHFAARP